ncbi:hypothetical protein [Parasitella parasitica]|uniref:GOLD domain-containing protein n=1 Tax=Parasitella parasitica TaxID=35722 RepID=A0A0B7MY78_9FUNG|nr:hypothetical protein [Parasitella parasitica]
MSVIIKPGEVQCYHEELEVGEKITVSYQVGDGGNHDIDFLFKDPTDATIISTTKISSNSHSLQANIEGRYTYCFSNEFSTVSEKKVGFNIHENIQKIHDSIKEHTYPLEKEIAELAESIFAVKAQQEYIVVRERQHRDTAESTNARVKWWSIAQLGPDRRNSQTCKLEAPSIRQALAVSQKSVAELKVFQEELRNPFRTKVEAKRKTTFAP